MPTWNLHSILPRRLKRGLNNSRLNDDICFWCHSTISDDHDDAFDGLIAPNWRRKGEMTLPSTYGCEGNPRTCRPWDDYHFHGYDADFDGSDWLPHNEDEALGAGIAIDDDTELQQHCVSGSHQTAGSVLEDVRARLIWRNNDYHPDSYIYEASDNPGIQIKERQLGRHCVNESCGTKDCHACNPDWQCEKHVSCMNALKCPSCNQDMNNVKIDWSQARHFCNEFDDEDEQNDSESHPEFMHVPARAFDNAAWDDSDEYSLQDFNNHPYLYEVDWSNRHPISYIMSATGSHADNFYDEYDNVPEWRLYSMLDQPQCGNKQCSNFGYE